MNSKCRQLVILAGGRGARLKPLTDSIPKPMLMIHGKSFLNHIIILGKSLGFSDIVILTGYLSEFFEKSNILDLKDNNLNIRLIESDENCETLERLASAKDYLDDEFCLTYGDVLIQLTPIEIEHFIHKDTDVKVLIYEGNGYHTKRNISIKKNKITYSSNDSNLREFDKLNLGWFLISKKIINNLTFPNISLEDFLLNSIEHTVSFTITPNLYYSLSNSNRIPKVFRYLDKSRRVILLDRDGTINKKAPKGEYVLEYNQFEWIRDSKELFYYLRVKNCEVFILTNQPAVGRNIVSKSDIDSLHSLIAGEIFRSQGRLDGIFACLHGWDDSCNCRKPNIGLFVLVQELFDIDWSRTLYIGDDERDREAAAKLGIKFALVDEDTLRIDDIVKPWLESFESEELL